MSILGRRPFLTGGLGLLGAGVLGWGGSVAVCSLGDRRTAMIRPLFVALADIRAPERIGRAWLDAEGAEALVTGLLVRPDLAGIALLPGAGDRRLRIAETVRADFAAGDVVLADRWVVARAEAQIAGAWVAWESAA